jgi:hypothetical protein
MAKDLKLSVLLDYYGDILTEKQKDVMELYYNEDLSLSEIAEHEHISRQGVRDSIKRGEDTVLDLEKKLKMAEKFTKISELFDKIKEKANAIYQESSTYNYSRVITDTAGEILNIMEENEDLF